MGKLIYSMLMSVDGYVADPDGEFDWNKPDEQVHSFINDQERSVSTYLYGRRMYQLMTYWETSHTLPDQTPAELEFARLWQAADKVVYSTTLTTPASERTQLHRAFDPAVVRKLKAESAGDVTVAGPTLAGHALNAGLVDECHMFVTPVIVGGGTRFLPDGLRVELDLLDERRFDNGVAFLRYALHH